MELSINDSKELIGATAQKKESALCASWIGEYVLIRTYSAGVWAGTLSEKSGNEVILSGARRLWYWKAKEGISLSAVATVGISSESKIAHPVEKVWLEAIEIIPMTQEATISVKEAPNAKAQ